MSIAVAFYEGMSKEMPLWIGYGLVAVGIFWLARTIDRRP